MINSIARGFALAFMLFSLQSPQAIGAEPVAMVPPDRLIRLLRDGDFKARQAALDALAANPSARSQYESVLRQALKDPDRNVRQQAAMALAGFGLGYKLILEELVQGMAEPHPGRYHTQPEDPRSAMSALVKLGAKAVPTLIPALENETFAGWYLVIKTVGAIGPPAKDALPALTKALGNRKYKYFHTIVEAKWRIDGDANYALKELIPLLETKDGRSCGGAIDVLTAMGPDAKDAVPSVIQSLKRYKETELVSALRKLAPHAKDLALPAIRQALGEAGLMVEAAIALQDLGIPAKEVVPHLLSRLDRCKEDGSDPNRIIYAIVIFGPQATPYAADLIRKLKHSNPDVRRAAAWGLCRVGADKDVVMAALTEALKDKETSEEAARSLQQLRGTK
jgi:HEAT repeat protein